MQSSVDDCAGAGQLEAGGGAGRGEEWGSGAKP